MTELPDGVNFRGFSYYRSKDDPTGIIYLPGEPTSEKDAEGKSTLMLWVLGSEATLQMGTRWSVEPEALQALSADLVARFPQELTASTIHFMPAPVTIEGVSVSIGDGTGQFEVLKTVASSGFPPYSAIFNEHLSTAQRTSVTAALNGRTGFLIVTYRGTLMLSVLAQTDITGDVHTDVADLVTGDIPSDSDGLIRMRIDQALAEGRLTLVHSGSSTVPDDLQARVDEQAKARAAALLLQMVQNTSASLSSSLDASHLAATAALRGTMQIPIERSVDVQSWFTSGEGAKHIRILALDNDGQHTSPAHPDKGQGKGDITPENGPVSPGGTAGNTAGTPTTVTVGFDAHDIPVAFIQVGQGEARTVLSGSAFAPVTLSAFKAGEPLTIKTNYTDGGPFYTSTLQSPTSQGWVLAPKDLGLVNVVVDGTVRQRAGASNARVRVRYHPSGSGTADDQTIYLRNDTWTASWYLVTRSADLGGTIEWEWKETTADGSIVNHPSINTSETTLTL